MRTMNEAANPAPGPAMAQNAPVMPSLQGLPNIQEWKKRLPTGVRGPIIAGLLIAALFVGGFGVWGATVPISGAAVASGIVAASGLNQEVNHLEGGLISKILVAEGQRVKSGESIIELDKTRVESERDRVNNQLLGIRARIARLNAEMEGAPTIEFPEELVSAAAGSAMTSDLEQQRREFVNRLERHQSELDVLAQRAQATNEEIAGLEIQKSSEETKLVVIRDELEQKKGLLDRGLTPRSQYNALQRAEADSEGRVGALQATIAQRKTSLIEIEKQINRQQASRSEEASAQINAANLEINDLTEQLRSRDDILKRMVIRSPVDGVVIKLSKNTVGSVIRPGETVVEILPTTLDLIIEARVPPQDIDVVRPGQNANVRFVALNTRTTPEVPAVVTYVSADRLVDQDTRVPYYLARLQLTGDLPAPLTRDQIYPGMPVDAFIGTGERTFFEYLARPILDSFNKAFREQ
jgi:HlyD family secretion protein